MKKIIYIFWIVLGGMALLSCYDDEGNYNYNTINEVAIDGFGDNDTTYQLLYLIDTLRIPITITGTLDKEGVEENYEYRWELADQSGENKKIIATTRSLELPMDMTPGTYYLYYSVKDKSTGIVVTYSNSLVIGLSYTKGYMILGDREDGTVQMDMIAMVDSRQDTSILRDMLKNSGLPELKGAIEVCHTGQAARPDFVKLWIMTESGSYYLNGATLQGSIHNDFASMFYTSLDIPKDVHPVSKFPRLAGGNGSGTVGGSYRGYILNDGSIVYTSTIMEEFYGNPINRLSSTSNELLELFPYVFYSPTYLRGMVVYDKKNERFLGTTATSPSIFYTFRDTYSRIFPWNQEGTGRTLIHGDNTKNTLNNSTYGRSYALMKDTVGEYFIYCFHTGSYISYLSYGTMYDQYITNEQKGYWEIDKSIATNIDQADRYLFSSTYTYLYYAVGSKVYCYDYGTKRCDVVADFGSGEITWWDVDYWTESAFDRILVATYNGSTGGTLTKFRESEDQNVLTWTETDSKWSGFPKIKSVNWRNSSM